MAKSQTTVSTPNYQLPEGYQKHSGDVVGFHDPEKQGPIHGIPRGAKLSDSDLENEKPSCFVIFELLDPCTVTEGSGEEKEEKQAKKGDMVGVWVKGGMGGLKNLCGVPVFMVHTGEKKLKGRPAAQSAMKTYDFHVPEKANGKGKPIPLIEDNRKQSKGKDHPFFKTGAAKPQREPGDDTEEDYGF